MSIVAPTVKKRRGRPRGRLSTHRDADYEPYDGAIGVNLSLDTIDDLPAMEDDDLDALTCLWLPRPVPAFLRRRV